MFLRSGSMDPGCITPLYIYRMWGGTVSMEDIENAMEDGRNCRKSAIFLQFSKNLPKFVREIVFISYERTI